ncbi:MAG TPA: hypothetical protein VK993_03180 [Chthoniobacterales bacterium]|nr:hypothetical protein [Chthoniobacterales bacterium]
MKVLLGVAALGCVAIGLFAQQSPAPGSSATSGKGPRISFLPPPIEGTLSLGIYDAKGKLVRALHREADVDEFDIGSDSLSTTWDGKNDAGESMPPGRYFARGYAVGDIGVEGVGYFFNDWVTDDDSPRVTKITAIKAADDGFTAVGTLASGGVVTLVADEKGNVKTSRNDAAADAPCDSAAGLPGVAQPVDCDIGKDQTLWVIDRPASSSQPSEVKQFSRDKELLRRLAISPDDPQPRKIAASREADRIFLLEESDAMQRTRGLTLVATKDDAGQAVSDWKVQFEKKIVPHSDFGVENGKPIAVRRGGDGLDRLKVRLQKNPLQDDKKSEVELIAASDEQGSVLKTADGLPLQTISETAGLRRVVIAPSGEKSVDVFQDDGAVVEQFRVGNLDQMMAFDCGEFELK